MQWHFGLEVHDGVADLDWEGRIEIKLVSVWRAPDGRITCDKLKVCDLAVDPWKKMANVLFVFADRLTRVVVGAAFFHLGGPALRRLSRCWHEDPHFGEPQLFVEAREQAGRMAPAYYLSHRWLADEELLPPHAAPVFSFDRTWWNAARAEHGRDPLPTIVEPGTSGTPCRRCGGFLRHDAERLARDGWAPAWHAMPLGEKCAIAGHFVVNARELTTSSVCTYAEYAAALELRCERRTLWRLADRVPEPEDHLHGYDAPP